MTRPWLAQRRFWEHRARVAWPGGVKPPVSLPAPRGAHASCAAFAPPCRRAPLTHTRRHVTCAPRLDCTVQRRRRPKPPRRARGRTTAQRSVPTCWTPSPTASPYVRRRGVPCSQATPRTPRLAPLTADATYGCASAVLSKMRAQERADELARLESEDSGKTLKMASTVDIPRAVANFKFFAGELRHSESGKLSAAAPRSWLRCWRRLTPTPQTRTSCRTLSTTRCGRRSAFAA